jgi:DNA primase
VIDTKERVEILVRVLGPCQVDRRGINAAFRCPDCGNSKKQKFVVKLDTGQYHCWVCEAKGASVAKILRKTSPEIAAKWESVTGVYQRQFIDEVVLPPKVEMPIGFRLLAESFESNDPDTRACVDYVMNRGLGLRDMWYFRLGCVRKGRLARRVIMPSFDGDGKLNYWTARSIDNVSYGKYVNPSVPRGEFIFNELNIDWRQEVTLVEGPFDLTKCDTNSTAILGSNMSRKSALFQGITRSRTPVVLALDSDMPEKQHKWAKALSEFDVSVRIMDLNGHKDVGEMTKEQFLEAKKKAKHWNKFQGIINLSRITRSGSIF